MFMTCALSTYLWEHHNQSVDLFQSFIWLVPIIHLICHNHLLSSPYHSTLMYPCYILVIFPNFSPVSSAWLVPCKMSLQSGDYHLIFVKKMSKNNPSTLCFSQIFHYCLKCFSKLFAVLVWIFLSNSVVDCVTKLFDQDLFSLWSDQDAKFMEGVKGVSQVTTQPRLSQIQRKCQVMAGWKRYCFQT